MAAKTSSSSMCWKKSATGKELGFGSWANASLGALSQRSSLSSSNSRWIRRRFSHHRSREAVACPRLRKTRWCWNPTAHSNLVDGGGEDAIRRAVDAGDLNLAITALEVTKIPSELPQSLAFEILALVPSNALLTEKQANALYYQLGPERHNLLRGFSASRQPGQLPFRKRIVTDEDVLTEAGVPLAALRPRRGSFFIWQLLGIATVLGMSYLLRASGNAELLRPLGLSFLLTLLGDQLLFRGAFFEGVLRIVNPRHREKVVRHEAGHFLVAYLLGMPIRGYVLNSMDAIRVAGIRGQAGTVFADEVIERELKNGRLSEWSIDRFTIVVMAGIASEALKYGQAEGGRSDEDQLVQLLSSLMPPWTLPNIVNQAKFGAIEALLLLRKNGSALDALVQAIGEEKPLGACIERIDNLIEREPVTEETQAADREEVNEIKRDLRAAMDGSTTLDLVSGDQGEARLERIEAIEREEHDIENQLKEIEGKLDGLA
uniref:Peptidase M41 domain-containing protein n=1 Tax=Compsopogon caeruleus TaxID=31354 RepID=A0A7S1XEF1_9RHOD|mmetsp:Transcript_5108/g.10361  ORF Transcript_5108/g.10361 Transcript_5108/m.10361 type:complete len:489 (+) Transcript_5108:272-1738(+)|eukprot:CAMPEP_0184689616 /NCGR_PEP_ID=MMETSP0312-20130426/30749_1 /TAXON_ID=31354 /ORGANISM="Compsopogon coeruleus, Strain SAG 36.94" /LENGTH=488 /DNA_ID=CAMNT_0027146987 /DNA_START=855 /DNA_END=2321 /DNA_ORIENTATION=-